MLKPLRICVSAVTLFLGTTVIGFQFSSHAVSAVTAQPTIQSPVARDSFNLGSSNPTIAFSLPNTPLAGQATLMWSLSSSPNATMRLLTINASIGSNTFGPIDLLAPESSFNSLPAVRTITTLIGSATNTTSRMPAGTYSILVSYQNSLGDQAANQSVSQIELREPCASGQTSNDGYSPCTAVTTTTTTAPTTTVPQNLNVLQTLCSVKKGKSITQACLAKNAKITIASSSKVKIKVATSSSKVCKLNGTSIKTLKAGTCSTTLTVTPKKGKAKSYKVKVVITL